MFCPHPEVLPLRKDFQCAAQSKYHPARVHSTLRPTTPVDSLKPSDRVLNTPEQYAGALRPTITADGRILFWRIDTNLGVERRFTCAYPTHSCEKQYTKLGGGVDFTLSYLVS